MKRKEVRHNRLSRSIPVLVFIGLLALFMANFAQAAPLAQGPSSVYGMTLSPQDIKLCVGHGELFIVTVPLNETRQMSDQSLRTFEIYYSGEEVTAEVRNTNVGTISPPRLETSVVRGGLDDAMLTPLVPVFPRRSGNVRVGFSDQQQLWFYFTAKEKGTTVIDFKHTNGVLGAPLAASLTAQVEVVDCWEAYATGLWTGNAANNWIKKDICSLERPFHLEGTGVSEAAGTTLTAKSRAFFFWPMQPFGVAGLTALQDGRYIYVGGHTISGFGITSHCTLVGSGSYQQFLFENRTPKEGNHILYGSSTRYCEGNSVHTDQESIQVAFRALGAGQACQESLPGLNP